MKLVVSQLKATDMRRNHNDDLVVDRFAYFAGTAYTIRRTGGPLVPIPSSHGMATCSDFWTIRRTQSVRDVIRHATCALCARLISDNLENLLEYYIVEVFRHPKPDHYGVLAYQSADFKGSDYESAE